MGNDVIQLNGSKNDYVLGRSIEWPTHRHTAVYLDKPTMEPDELMGIG